MACNDQRGLQEELERHLMEQIESMGLTGVEAANPALSDGMPGPAPGRVECVSPNSATTYPGAQPPAFAAGTTASQGACLAADGPDGEEEEEEDPQQWRRGVQRRQRQKRPRRGEEEEEEEEEPQQRRQSLRLRQKRQRQKEEEEEGQQLQQEDHPTLGVHQQLLEPAAAAQPPAVPEAGAASQGLAVAAAVHGQPGLPAEESAGCAAAAAAGAAVGTASGQVAGGAHDCCPACGQPAVRYVGKVGKRNPSDPTNPRNVLMRKFREEGEAEVGADATGPVKKAAAEAAERRFLFNHRVTRTLSYRELEYFHSFNFTHWKRRATKLGVPKVCKKKKDDQPGPSRQGARSQQRDSKEEGEEEEEEEAQPRRSGLGARSQPVRHRQQRDSEEEEEEEEEEAQPRRSGRGARR